MRFRRSICGMRRLRGKCNEGRHPVGEMKRRGRERSERDPDQHVVADPGIAPAAFEQTHPANEELRHTLADRGLEGKVQRPHQQRLYDGGSDRRGQSARTLA